MDDDALLAVLDEACAAARHALDGLDDWGPAGTRPGQYRLDLAADGAALPVLHGAGLAVLSEESGRTGGDRPLLAVIDPVDGSTNAHRRIPFWSTSICVLDEEGPRVAVVVNQATGRRYQAVRGSGATCDGAPIAPSGCGALAEAIVGISGFPAGRMASAQFRALGAASLELCAVAEGVLDAYRVVGGSHLFGWDYLGAWLVCREVGVAMADLDGFDLVLRDDSRRRPAAAATGSLLAELVASPV